MTDTDKAQNYEFHPSISAEEREFYLKAYPTPDNVRDRRTHCTTCKVHLGTAPANIENIKMHPILRVTHCPKCQDFYNCGEFSKGEDGSELYCRWCGQGGEVYCCSNCPFVFCKSCITKNLSRGVVADIEQNENWRCFACAPKILWPLRAVHWALVNYIEKQKKEIEAMNLTEEEKRQELAKDRSNCCRLAKAKCGNMSDSMDSIDSAFSKRSQSSNSATKKKLSTPSPQTPAAKRPKNANNEVVCTPDLMSMLEPDCQLTVTQKSKPTLARPVAPKVIQLQQTYTPPPARSLAPPPLIQLRSPNVQLRPMSSNAPVIRRTVVSPRTPSPAGSQSPVYHTINGYRIDLNSAAQQGTYRLPNGKLIQVKRQSAPTPANQNPVPPPVSNWQQRTPVQSPVQRLQLSAVTQPRSFVSVQQQQQQQSTPAPPLRYTSGVVGSTVISPFNQNGPQIQMVNGGVNVVSTQQPAATATAAGQPVQIRPVMVRHTFPNNAYGVARTQFQDQIFNAMEICQHLTGKIQTLTNSNAYKTAKNYLELKELYIHMSYLLTYAIGRFKGLQDKCLGDMRQLGFGTDADSLENGQLAAGVDYVRYGQLEDVELFTANINSFHNQIYEYRKSLLANMEHLEDRPPLSPLHDLKGLNDDEIDENLEQSKHSAQQNQRRTSDWHSTANYEDDDDDVQEVAMNDESSTLCKDAYADDDGQDFDDTIENEFYGGAESGGGGGGYGAQRSTEDVMRREEESHAYDRKLTRLIQQYPSIWCTRHPDYGNFEVTRKQWRTIASHFTYSADMKMRWKNIRKRYVRIERRMQEGKRFNGYFDKATNFLINRDRPMNEWVQVDCGTDDGDVYERQKLDQIEKELHGSSDVGGSRGGHHQRPNEDYDEPLEDLDSSRPVEIKPLDAKIIHFVKCNPVLWRKSSDPQFHKMDEQTRKSLWMHLWKSVPYVRCADLVDRWTQLYEMYKTFRLKTIKSERALAALELKYSKYLAKLYFLYKIDEEELINEDKNLIFGDPFDDDAEEQSNTTSKAIDKPDDKEFLLALVRAIRHYPAIWDENNQDFHDMLLREESWREIAGILEQYGHKQASDNEDDDIEIVEPKTDTINLDSDEESSPTTKPSKPTTTISSKPTTTTTTETTFKEQMQKINIPAKIRPVGATVPEPMLVPMGSNQEDDNASTAEDMTDFMSAAHTLLASMLEVDIIEGDTEIHPGGKPAPKKQPRKKTTNKPNPTLLKQKRMLERQKMEELKQNDSKLKMECLVNVQRVDAEYPNFKEKLEDLEKLRKEWRDEQARQAKLAELAREAKQALEIAEAEKIADNKEDQQAEENISEASKSDKSGVLMKIEAVGETEKMECSQDAETAETDEARKADTEDTEISKQPAEETGNQLKIQSVGSLIETVVECDESTEKTAVKNVENSKKEDIEKAAESEAGAETDIEKMETETAAEKEEEYKPEDIQKETIEEKPQDLEKTVEAENVVQLKDEQHEENKKENDFENAKIEVETESIVHEKAGGNGVEIPDVDHGNSDRIIEKNENKDNDRNAIETDKTDYGKSLSESKSEAVVGMNEVLSENKEEKTEDDNAKGEKEVVRAESQETANEVEKEKSLQVAAEESSAEKTEKPQENIKTSMVLSTRIDKLEKEESIGESTENMEIDEFENKIEENSEIHETVAQVAENESAQEPPEKEERLLEEMETVLAAEKTDAQSTKELPVVEAIEINNSKPQSPNRNSKEDGGAVEACLDLEPSKNITTPITHTDNTCRTDDVIEQFCEKMDVDAPTPVELPIIAKPNEIQIADANTAQTDDVEMAALTIEKDTISNNE